MGVPIIGTIVFWGLYWGPLILGNNHLGSGFRASLGWRQGGAGEGGGQALHAALNNVCLVVELGKGRISLLQKHHAPKKNTMLLYTGVYNLLWFDSAS